MNLIHPKFISKVLVQWNNDNYLIIIGCYIITIKCKPQHSQGDSILFLPAFIEHAERSIYPKVLICKLSLFLFANTSNYPNIKKKKEI